MTSSRPSDTINRQVAKIELDNGVSFTINEANLPLLIGRDPDCGICISIASVSRHHCELYLQGSQLYLRDLSTNGTLVGSRRLKGKNIPIRMPTRIHLADSPVMTVTPCSISPGTKLDKTHDSNRHSDRRCFVRRANVLVVDFERRSEQPRRVETRRARQPGADIQRTLQ